MGRKRAGPPGMWERPAEFMGWTVIALAVLAVLFVLSPLI